MAASTRTAATASCFGAPRGGRPDGAGGGGEWRVNRGGHGSLEERNETVGLVDRGGGKDETGKGGTENDRSGPTSQESSFVGPAQPKIPNWPAISDSDPGCHCGWWMDPHPQGIFYSIKGVCEMGSGSESEGRVGRRDGKDPIASQGRGRGAIYRGALSRSSPEITQTAAAATQQSRWFEGDKG